MRNSASNSPEHSSRALPFALAVLAVLVAGYVLLLRLLAAQQGAEPNWSEAGLWVLTALTTGATDIAWQSTTGVLFETLVRLTGVVLLIVLVRWAVVSWSPRTQPGASGLLEDGADVETIARDSAVVLLGDTSLARAMAAHPLGAQCVVVPAPSSATASLAPRLSQARHVVLTEGDLENFARARQLQGLSGTVAATATTTRAGEILAGAGVDRVCVIDQLLAQSLCRRVIGRDSLISVVRQDGDLILAEANTATTPLGGRPLKDWHDTLTPVSVLGSWEGSRYETATPETVVPDDGVLLLAGTGAQLVRMEAVFGVGNSDERVIIIGKSTIANPLADLLKSREIEATIVSTAVAPTSDGSPQRPESRLGELRGSGGPVDEQALIGAGLADDEGRPSPTVVIATDSDSLTLFATLLCRQINPRARIIAVCDSVDVADELSAAGAAFTVSRAALATQQLLDIPSGDGERVAEGLFLYSLDVPETFRGKTLAESSIRVATGATVVAVEERGDMAVNPAPETLLGSECRLHLVGDSESRQSFLAQFG